jgi:hypothetical protein
LPGVSDDRRARAAALTFAPQNGQTDSLRLMSARQFGHIRVEEP